MSVASQGVHFAVLAYDRMTALDMVGPFEVFSAAAKIVSAQKNTAITFRCAIIGLHEGQVKCESGLSINPHYTFANCPAIDTLIVPGGCGLREPETNQRVAKWLQDNHQHFRRVGSTCTGIYGLAAAGLLDQRRVTTHWQYADDVAKKFPQLNMQADAIFIRDGKFYTSAGITAGIDLALALVEEDCGASVALAVARELVVYLRRSGGQSQYSDPLRFQSKANALFSDLIAWIHGNLKKDLSVAVLAERAGLSVRQFNRRFDEHFSCSPSHYVETLRLDEARQRLLLNHTTIEVVADSLGFRSSDVFRRAFQRRFGLSPSDYQRHFSATGTMESLS